MYIVRIILGAAITSLVTFGALADGNIPVDHGPNAHVDVKLLTPGYNYGSVYGGGMSVRHDLSPNNSVTVTGTMTQGSQPQAGVAYEHRF